MRRRRTAIKVSKDYAPRHYFLHSTNCTGSNYNWLFRKTSCKAKVGYFHVSQIRRDCTFYAVACYICIHSHTHLFHPSCLWLTGLKAPTNQQTNTHPVCVLCKEFQPTSVKVYVSPVYTRLVKPIVRDEGEYRCSYNSSTLCLLSSSVLRSSHPQRSSGEKRSDD